MKWAPQQVIQGCVNYPEQIANFEGANFNFFYQTFMFIVVVTITTTY